MVALEARRDFRSRRNDKENDVAGRRHFARRRDVDPGQSFKCSTSCRGDVPHRKRYTRFVEIARYAATHIPQSDNTDFPFSHDAPPREFFLMRDCFLKGIPFHHRGPRIVEPR
jgi:hypothetical protein